MSKRTEELHLSDVDKKFNVFLNGYGVKVDFSSGINAEEFATLAEIFDGAALPLGMVDSEKDKYFEKLLDVTSNSLSREVTSAIRWRRYPCQSILPGEITSQVENEMTSTLIGQDSDAEFVENTDMMKI